MLQILIEHIKIHKKHTWSRKNFSEFYRAY